LSIHPLTPVTVSGSLNSEIPNLRVPRKPAGPADLQSAPKARQYVPSKLVGNTPSNQPRSQNPLSLRNLMFLEVIEYIVRIELETPLVLIQVMVAVSLMAIKLFRDASAFGMAVKDGNIPAALENHPVALGYVRLLVRIVSGLGGAIIVAAVCLWVMPHPEVPVIPSAFALLKLFLIVAFVLDIMLSVIVHQTITFLLTGDSMLRRQSNGRIGVVVCLSDSSRVKGKLSDLGIIFSADQFAIEVENGDKRLIDKSTVLTAFLWDCPENTGPFSTERFTEGPKTLVLKYPHCEVFMETKYYDRLGFRLFRVNKPTSSTEVALVRTECLESLTSPETRQGA